MLWTGAAFFRVEGLTNAWTYSPRRSGAALKDMYLRNILAVNKNCQTRQLTLLKNNKAQASKKSNDNEKRCLKDNAIDNCECERLREKFVSLREERSISSSMVEHTMITAQKSRRRSRICRIKEKARWLPISNAF
jgi:hypothetical protein